MNNLVDNDLINALWKKLEINDKKFSFKFFFTQNKFEVLVFDSKHFKLYNQTQKGEYIMKLFKVSFLTIKEIKDTGVIS